MFFKIILEYKSIKNIMPLKICELRIEFNIQQFYYHKNKYRLHQDYLIYFVKNSCVKVIKTYYFEFKI